jgi:hypothetical protein
VRRWDRRTEPHLRNLFGEIDETVVAGIDILVAVDDLAWRSGTLELIDQTGRKRCGNDSGRVGRS